MLRKVISVNCHQIFDTNKTNSKNLWKYVASAFNQVDNQRLELVGPDRLCAEWILKNSGAISFTQAPDKFLRDYNSLPPENLKFKVQKIDASNSSIMGIGFDHLKNCKNIDEIILHNCKHLENDGLNGLIYIKDTLQNLQISNCYNLVNESLMIIKELKNLKKLKLSELQFVNDINIIAKELKSSLPNCKLEITV